MTNLPDGASLPVKDSLPGDDVLSDDIAELEAQMALFEQAQKDCEIALRRLVEAEDTAKGITFAKEIHEARQLKLQLGVSRELRRVRINRIRANAAFF